VEIYFWRINCPNSETVNWIVNPAEAYLDFLPRSTGQDRVCAFL
jgi:hypothetical protein